jgi:predicted secreted Zn-dependent protease
MTRAATAALLLAATPVLEDRNDFQLEYVTVAGSTEQALRADLDAKGTRGEDGVRSDGYTQWTLTWNFDTEPRVGGCTTRRVFVDLVIRMTLPRWYPPAGTDPDLVARWNRYADALRLHEDGHRYRAEATAGDIRRVLTLGRGSPDCGVLRKQLNARAHELLGGLRQNQAAYDRDTRRGETQGARRP